MWEQIERVLKQPDLIMECLSDIEDEDKKANTYEHELEMVERRLSLLDNEQTQLLQWALKGFPEDQVISENKRINQTRADLIERSIELEELLESAKEAKRDFDSVKRACQFLLDSNWDNLTFGTKRIVLETIRLRVKLNGSTVEIQGTVPAVASTLSSTGQKETLSKDTIYPGLVPIMY